MIKHVWELQSGKAQHNTEASMFPSKQNHHMLHDMDGTRGQSILFNVYPVLVLHDARPSIFSVTKKMTG